MDWWTAVSTIVAGFVPVLPHFAALTAFLVFVLCPIPGRGPRRSQGRDPWRRFKYESRRIVMERAGHRCEDAVFLAWGQCRDLATFGPPRTAPANPQDIHCNERTGPTVAGLQARVRQVSQYVRKPLRSSTHSTSIGRVDEPSGTRVRERTLLRPPPPVVVVPCGRLRLPRPRAPGTF